MIGNCCSNLSPYVSLYVIFDEEKELKGKHQQTHAKRFLAFLKRMKDNLFVKWCFFVKWCMTFFFCKKNSTSWSRILWFMILKVIHDPFILCVLYCIIRLKIELPMKNIIDRYRKIKVSQCRQSFHYSFFLFFQNITWEIKNELYYSVYWSRCSFIHLLFRATSYNYDIIDSVSLIRLWFSSGVETNFCENICELSYISYLKLCTWYHREIIYLDYWLYFLNIDKKSGLRPYNTLKTEKYKTNVSYVVRHSSICNLSSKIW